MLRYAAALATVLVLSIALADSLDASRDDNLLYIDQSCLLVIVSWHKADNPAVRQDIQATLMDKALLYSVPVKKDCTPSEYENLPTLLVGVTALNTGFDYSLDVVLPRAAWAPQDGAPHFFADAVIWEESGLMTSANGIVKKDIEDQVAKLFDDFALVWKKKHLP